MMRRQLLPTGHSSVQQTSVFSSSSGTFYIWMHDRRYICRQHATPSGLHWPTSQSTNERMLSTLSHSFGSVLFLYFTAGTAAINTTTPYMLSQSLPLLLSLYHCYAIYHCCLYCLLLPFIARTLTLIYLLVFVLKQRVFEKKKTPNKPKSLRFCCAGAEETTEQAVKTTCPPQLESRKNAYSFALFSISLLCDIT